MKKVAVFLIVVSLIAGGFAQPIRFACVGNSITSGAGDPKTNPDTYPAQLRILMGEEYDIQNYGVSGRTLLKNGDYPLWDETAFSEALEFNPNIVTIMLGTNDSKPYNWIYKDEFVPDFNAMIDTFRSLPANPDIYLCIPPPAFSIQWDIDDSIITADIIPRIQQVATDKSTPLIDFRTPFVDKNYLFPDDIHPNAEGCWEFAKIFYSYFTSDTVRTIQDNNLALDQTILTSMSIEPPEYLVDGDKNTVWINNDGTPVVIDLGSLQSVDMFQVFYYEESVYQYYIETSTDNSSWTTVVDKMTNDVSGFFTFDDITPVDAQYIRLTVNRTENSSASILIREFKIMETAPVHAPILNYGIKKVLSSSIRFDVFATSTQSGGYLKYQYANGTGEPFEYGVGFRSDTVFTLVASILKEAERLYVAKYYNNGYEIVSDTLRLDVSLTGIAESPPVRPSDFTLERNYPNPFNAGTMITFQIGRKTPVQLDLVNLRGEHVRQLIKREYKPGRYQIALNGSDLTSGIYFIRMRAGNSTIAIRKIALLK